MTFTCKYIIDNVNQDETGCWIWRLSKNYFGYGKATDKNKSIHAHRLAFKIFHGELLDTELVLHKCDNPACVNPLHLEKGSHKKNTQDMFIRKRGKQKLSVEDVRYIQSCKREYGMTKFLAEKYGVSRGHIHNIRCKHSWGWL